MLAALPGDLATTPCTWLAQMAGMSSTASASTLGGTFALSATGVIPSSVGTAHLDRMVPLLDLMKVLLDWMVPTQHCMTR